MLQKLLRKQAGERWFVLLVLLACLVLFWLPTGFPSQEDGYVRSRAIVNAVDNSEVHQRGVVQTGVQGVSVEVADGPFKGAKLDLTNTVLGKLEMDKIFQPGDQALVVIKGNAAEIEVANLIDHYRLDVEILLFGLFTAFLLWYARWTGVKAVLSFVFTILCLWKILWPLFLKGWDPILLSLLVVSMIVGCVIFLVAGLNRKALAAFLGTVSGAAAACILALLFGKLFRVHGAVVPYAETLLHLGFSNLDLSKIFFAGIFLASSGAMMDVAVDIAVAIGELVNKKPDITRAEAIASARVRSGFLLTNSPTATAISTATSIIAPEDAKKIPAKKILLKSKLEKPKCNKVSA